MKDFAASFRAMLDEAQGALNGGDASDGERRAKAVSALVRAERDVAEFLNETHAANLEDDDGTMRTAFAFRSMAARSQA